MVYVSPKHDSLNSVKRRKDDSHIESHVLILYFVIGNFCFDCCFILFHCFDQYFLNSVTHDPFLHSLPFCIENQIIMVYSITTYMIHVLFTPLPIQQELIIIEYFLDFLYNDFYITWVPFLFLMGH